MRRLLIASALLLGACGTTLTSVDGGGAARRAPQGGASRGKSPATRRVPPAESARAGRCEEALPLIRKVAQAHDVDVGLVVGLVHVESGFRADIENSHTGAAGLMQIMPATGRGFECGDLLDAEDNLECGVRVLKRYLDRYKGNMAYGLAAYNAGPKSPDQAWSDGRLPRNFGFAELVLRERARFLRGGCGS